MRPRCCTPLTLVARQNCGLTSESHPKERGQSWAPKSQPAPPLSLLHPAVVKHFNQFHRFNACIYAHAHSLPDELVGHEVAFFGELLAAALLDEAWDDLAIQAGGGECSKAARIGGEAARQL